MFFVFISPLLGTERKKSALQHVVLASWRSRPVETPYNPLQVNSSPPIIIFCF